MGKKYFELVDPRVNFPKLEEKILEFWEKEKIFEKSISDKPEDKTWTFLDGPPFITGLPHYGTLLSSIPKDLFPRFWTMKGYRVRRVWGWDCHGLPAENKVETKLGLKSKRDIEEKIGVKKFIDECKLYVSEVSSEWEWYVNHIARWVDFKNAYKTMDTSYMESVMWVFKGMYDKGYIYKGLRVSLYCPHDSTPISNFEVAMDADNYKEVTEASNTYKYQLEGEANTYFLAWSTTPWNKLATPALAVNPKLKYVKVKEGDEFYILAATTLKILKGKKHEIVDKFLGSKLVGMKFVPHYDFYKIDDGKKAFEIIPGDFVTAEEGTGIVTIAAYGEEDLEAMNKHNIQVVQHVDDEGMVTKDSPIGGGMYYLKVNKLVNEDLEKRGLMYREDMHTHTIPTCWRCHTRLFYKPQDAWYVDVQALKPQMKKTNKDINWFPEHFKMGRFLKSLEAAPDWCISRSRYWGSPVPVWECECGERFVPGSISELEKESGMKVRDLHKPEIDKVIVKCKKCGKTAKRVPEVLDSWIEAGSASFAERHFPFEKDVKLTDFFPPDFIVEYTGQIRAWFYVLHVISNALYKSIAFKNVMVTGVILGTDGRKMSKNFGNYPDPKEMLQKYGGDALRLYLMSTPVMRGEDALISEEQYRNQVKNFLLILWNTYNYFVTYSNLVDWKPSTKETLSKNVLDKWIIVSTQKLTNDVTEKLETYDTVSYVENLQRFLTDLSTWYLRRSRGRKDDDFYSTFYNVLITFCKLSAPIAPFISEEIYKNLTKEESVHLADWPKSRKLNEEEEKLLQGMEKARKIVEAGHAIRKEKQIALRQPLNEVKITESHLEEYFDLIKDELNVKNVSEGSKEVQIDTNITPELKAEGEMRDIVRKIQEERKNLKTALDEKVEVELPEWPKDFEDEIMKRALVSSIKKGAFKVSKLK
ncbi:MAG TPA: isoleucine--tRNA ligase [Candidatus Saccharimonadales bacterium]|nr:isoleucine--tRNA ligase [Candidatus Saccharimonadales bacterium]